MPEINQQQVKNWLQVTLSASGPIAVWVLSKTGMSEGDYSMYVNIALLFLPGLTVAAWGWLSQRRSAQVAAVATFTPSQQAEALAKTPDAAKVLIAKAVPGVATVVIKDTAGNGLAKLAQSPAQPDIVTETDNAKDVKAGTRA